ncbi:MAG: efflux RND transporter permease subunit [Cytophagales bacterium]|nr:efflux RND transporter permease subunit [Armatimonadota bacterium]
MQTLARICIQRPVFATVLILALVVVGLFAIPNLGLDRFPNVDFPSVTVTTTLQGATPEEMDSEVTEEIEKQVGSVSGIDTISSTSSEGVSVVTIQFVLERNGDEAAQDVRSKIDLAIPNLPEDAERPIVQKFGSDAAPIMQFTLSAENTSIRDLSEYSDKTLRPQLESINGVGEVQIIGGRLRQINVLVDPYKLRSFGLTAVGVRDALRRQNQQVPGGSFDEGERRLSVRTQGRATSTEELRQLVIKDQSGSPVRLGDVATVEDGEEEPTSLASINNKPAVVLSVRKQSGANSVAVIDAIKAKLKEIQPTFPAGYTTFITNDQSVFTKAAVAAVQEHLILGSVLAALVVLIFLWNWRSTLISAFAIPSSIIATFALMYSQGFTLNVITLLALTLAVGIVIDDAIIVIENIYRYLDEKGMNPKEAALAATNEIGLAVLATTLSLVAVFLPVAFMTGIVGRFLNSFGLTMAFAIIVSLFVAFTLTPMLASQWLKAPKKTAGADGGHGGASKQSGVFGALERAYASVLRWSLRHRWVVVLICIGTLFTTVPLGARVGGNFLPDEDESQFIVSVRTKEGANLAATQSLLSRIADDLRKFPEVTDTIITVGSDPQQTQNKGDILVKMRDISERKTDNSQFDLMARARTLVKEHYPSNLRTLVSPPNAFGGGAQAGLQFVITGPDNRTLADAANKVVAGLKATPGIADADTSVIVGKPELSATVDRTRAGDIGVGVGDVASTLRILVAGEDVTDFPQNGEQYDINVRSLPRFRSNASLNLFAVPSSNEGVGSVTVDQVTRFAEGTAPSTVERFSRQRSVTVTANLVPGTSAQTVQGKVQDLLKQQNLGLQYQGQFIGQSRELGKTFVAFGVAFLLSIIFMYLILAAQFESWLHPITILISLPLTVPFAILSLLITGNSLNIYSLLGILVLFGIVKKNSILQVDHANQLRAGGLPREQAIVQASQDRLRPILMTTIAFVAGLLPLVLSSGVGSGTNRATGGVIVGGQLLSLGLTLVATPVFYSLFDDISLGTKRLRKRLFGKSEEDEENGESDGDGPGGAAHRTNGTGGSPSIGGAEPRNEEPGTGGRRELADAGRRTTAPDDQNAAAPPLVSPPRRAEPQS